MEEGSKTEQHDDGQEAGLGSLPTESSAAGGGGTGDAGMAGEEARREVRNGMADWEEVQRMVRRAMEEQEMEREQREDGPEVEERMAAVELRLRHLEERWRMNREGG